MKAIGIVSACLGGTINFYSQLVQYSLSSYNSKTPEIILHQLPLQDYFTCFDDINKLNKLSDLLLSSIKTLEEAGARLIVIPNNTVHTVIDDILPRSSLPILSLLEVTKDHCKAANYREVLILGTRSLIRTEIYQKSLRNIGVQPVVLSEVDEDQLNQEIMKATQKGDLAFAFSSYIQEAISRISHLGQYDAILLACSDLVRSFHLKLNIPTINPLELLAKTAIDKAMQKNK